MFGGRNKTTPKSKATKKARDEMDAKIDASIAARKQSERARMQKEGMYPEGYERSKKEDAKFNTEFRSKFGLKNGGKVFKPCAACKTPAKCKAAGKCLAKAVPKKKAAPKKKMMSGGKVKGYMCGGKVKKK